MRLIWSIFNGFSDTIANNAWNRKELYQHIATGSHKKSSKIENRWKWCLISFRTPILRYLYFYSKIDRQRRILQYRFKKGIPNFILLSSYVSLLLSNGWFIDSGAFYNIDFWGKKTFWLIDLIYYPFTLQYGAALIPGVNFYPDIMMDAPIIKK